MGPSYANLIVSYIENKFFSNYQGPKADLYKRYLYIDDCVGATSSSREEPIYYLGEFFSPGLKYTWEISGNSLAFLEIKLSINDIEITSWKARAYGIFTRVGEVSEIERVSAANE